MPLRATASNILVMVTFLLCMASCQKSADDLMSPPTGDTTVLPPSHTDTIASGNKDSSDVDIYITGNNGDTAILWKNGKRTILSTGGPSKANGVFASGSDVYVVAVDSTGLGYYLKNGVRYELNSSGDYSFSGTCLFIDGNDVYVAGAGYPNQHAEYWKNGQGYLIGGATTPTSIAVLSGDVYTAGRYSSVSASYAKNADDVILPGWENYVSSFTRSVFISGNDIYFAGSARGSDHMSYGIYWKNGVSTILETGYFNFVQANAIVVSDNDVYVGGNNDFNQPVYWKNGVTDTLTRTIDSVGTVNAITISGKDVFTAGTVYTLQQTTQAMAAYWKNNQIHILTDGLSEQGSASSICVIKKH